MVRIQQEGFDIQSEVKKIKPSDESGIGALVTFVGYVRDFKDNKSDTLTSMEIEFYPGMTEKALLEIEEKARRAWDVFDVNIIHRFGKLNLNDEIVLVAVTSAHRTEAFRACEFIIDFLKTDAPFWKKEDRESGASWVDARETDYTALQRWDK
ncbi:MAG: molybdenum cofactor biosynthesis protein MoaE [Nitrosomonadales bacterium]|nr:molybdenum cofactor biosynthesis protein MoaE [Nitrosomonadales bacterium]